MSKVSARQIYDNFKPLEVCITLESQEEINALYCLFNHAKILKVLESHGFCTSDFRNLLTEYTTSYSDLWKDLQKIIP